MHLPISIKQVFGSMPENLISAIETYNDFLEVEPESTQAYCYMGDCFEQMNQLDDALDAFQKVIEIDNTDPEGWYGAGLIYHRQGSLPGSHYLYSEGHRI